MGGICSVHALLLPWWIDSDALAHVDCLRTDLVLQGVEGGAVVACLSSERLNGREVDLEERFLKLAVVLVHETLAALDLSTREGKDRSLFSCEQLLWAIGHSCTPSSAE
jgi:hypothetical protein